MAAANEPRFLFKANGHSFEVVSFKAREKISEPYRVTLELASEEELGFDDVLGLSGVLTIQGAHAAGPDEFRHIHGIVYQFEQSGFEGRFLFYEAVLTPHVHLLGLRSDCRIFQQLTIPQIITRVFEEAGVPGDLYTFRLQGHYRQRDYCVQYRETDLDFVRRMCAEEGIFYFFEHTPDAHVMVFGDSTINYQPIAGNAEVLFNTGDGLQAEQEAVGAFELEQQIVSDSFTTQDYNFEKPDLDLLSRAQEGSSNLARYDYPGAYSIPEQGRQLATAVLEQQVMYRIQGTGQSEVARFVPGFTFSLVDHVLDEANQAYLLTKANHEGRQPQVAQEHTRTDEPVTYTNTFTAIPATTAIRPEPVPKPFVHGSQTAFVTGPADQEIYTDRYGRVKVQFHWDRQGRFNEKSSCWVRVSQNWAGKHYGAMFIPRIGQEVIVDFIEGDPDRPIITGRVYNADNMPPYSLPDHKTVAAVKTRSTPGGEGFNELRFDDAKGAEQIFMHGQRDMDLRIKNDRRTFIGNDAHLTVQNDLFEQIRANHHRSVSDDHIRQVDGNQSVQVGKDSQNKVSGNFGLESANNIHLNTGATLVMEAGASLTLKAAASSVTIDSTGVSVSGPKINLNSGGSPLSGKAVAVSIPKAPAEADTAKPGFVEANPGKMVKVRPAEEPPPPAEPVAEKVETDWIEVRLLNQDQEPIRGCVLTFVLPNNQVVSGVTDTDGVSRIDRIKPGSCTVSLNDADRGIWKPYQPVKGLEE